MARRRTTRRTFRRSRRTSRRPKGRRTSRYKVRTRKPSTTNIRGSVARSRSTTFIPKTRKLSLMYRDTSRAITTPNGIGNVPVVRQYSCNSLFDPDITGIGHQPYLYDQVTALYDAVRCVTSIISVTFTNNIITQTFTGSGTNAVICGVYLAPRSSFPLTFAEIQEGPRCKFITLRPRTGADAVKTVTFSFDLFRARGKGFDAGAADDTVKTSAWNKTNTSLATETEWVYNIFVYTSSSATATGRVIPIDVAIRYNAEFAQPKLLAVS